MSFDEATYELIREGCKRSAAAVVPIVYELVKPRSVIDVGGGEGWWARAFVEAGTSRALVLDESLGELGTEETIGSGVLSRRYFDLEGEESLAAFGRAISLSVSKSPSILRRFMLHGSSAASACSRRSCCSRRRSPARAATGT
jgi:hypothetical protein